MHNLRDLTRRGVAGAAPSYPASNAHPSLPGKQSDGLPSLSASSPPLSPSSTSTRYVKARLVSAETPSTPRGSFAQRVCGVAPARFRRLLRIRPRSVLLGIVVVLLLLSFVFFDLMYDKILEYNARPSSAASAEVWGVEEFDAPTGAKSVLVQHHGAMARLNVTLEKECAIGGMFCNSVRLSPQLLPSWTLHTIAADCAVCTNAHDYADAVRGVTLADDYAVFATSSAPLGRVGPMLFAMSSVTDDVPVALEVPQWSWLHHVHRRFAQHWDDPGLPRTPYLAVMGVPSTDQPGRVALRTAQRATWMSYQEVARSENDFRGALLPLYLFAAVEPVEPEETAAATDADGGEVPVVRATTANSYAYVNASSIAPTVEEFRQATDARSAVREHEESVRYTQRRVNLRDGWDVEEPAASPCGRIVTHVVDENAAPSALTTLTSALGVLTTPTFVSGAQYICHASAGLWQEALTHRNVVWIDMMTDRRPTTKKKLGETGKWGLAVEVGMSQKLILWLEYAYHAFTDVPYIIKGDDDAYLKVPQFFNDVRLVMADAMALPRTVTVDSYVKLPLSNAAAAVATTTTAAPLKKKAARGKLSPTTVTPSLSDVDATPCLYWGSLRVYQGIRFAAGMTFMIHRNTAHAILSPSLRRRGVDVVKLATHTFHSKNTRAYRRSMFHREDMLLGLLVNASMPQSRQFCAQGKMFFMREGYPRFHDMHLGKVHDLTWSTVVAHRCKPADHHYLHYFFEHEHLLAGAAVPRGVTVEAHAQQRVKDWVMEQREALPDDVTGWETLPATVWTHKARQVPSYEVNDTDKVAVYHTRLRRLQHLPSRLEFGYEAEPVK